MKEYIALTISILSFLLALVKYITDEKRIKKKERQLEQSQIENGVYPPRKDKHRKR